MSRRLRLSISVGVWLAGLLTVLGAAQASDPAAELPLHERIDRLIEAAHDGPPARLVGDAEFLRRVTLDLLGRIPSAVETRAFVHDPAENKRLALVERLLAAPDFSRRLAIVLDVALMERRSSQTIPTAEWRKFLFESLQANKPFDQLAREILAADGVDPALRPAARFYIDRSGEANAIARDVGRMFFGRDMQCAQCHDHPIVDDYKQRDFCSLVAFVARSSLYPTETKKKKKKKPESSEPVVFIESATGEADFQSVFTHVKGTATPRLPGGAPLEDPQLAPGEDYQVKPDEETNGVPKYSRRARLAQEATSGANRAFKRNFANRVWALLFGRGLVDPVDLDHSANPPSHPDVLELLTDGVAALKYDLRAIVRELVLTRAYQRSIELPDDLERWSVEVSARLAQAESEQARLAAVAEQSTAAAREAEQVLSAAEKQVIALVDEVDKAEAAVAAARKEADAVNAAVAAAQAQVATKRDLAHTLTDAATKAGEAAGKLPDDKELSAAADKFKAAAEKVAGELASATKDLEEKQAAAKPKLDALAAAEGVKTAAVTKRDSAQNESTAALEQANVRRAQRGVDRAASLVVASRRDSSKAFVEYCRVTGVARASRAALVDQQTKQASASGQLEKARADLATTEAALAKLVAPPPPTTPPPMADPPGAAPPATVEAPPPSAELVAAQGVARQAAEQVAACDANLKALDAACAAATNQATADESVADAARRELTASWSRRFVVATLKPLSPEQLCWSAAEATGLAGRERTAVEAEWMKQPPAELANNPQALAAAKVAHVERVVYEKLSPQEGAFVSMFAASPGQPQQEFSATVDQALFFANGPQIRSWLAPGGGNLCERAAAMTDPAQGAEEIYLAVLSRWPSDTERSEVAEYLASRPDRPAAIQEIIWGLLTSSEFRFNH